MVRKKRPVAKKKVAKKKVASRPAPSAKKKVAKKKAAAPVARKKTAAKKTTNATPSGDFSTRIVVGPCRIAFQNLDEKNDDGKFSCLLAFPVESTKVPETNRMSGTVDAPGKKGHASLQEVVDHLVQERFKGKTGGLTLPIKDGDDDSVESHAKYADVFSGNMYINAKSDYRPQVVDTDREEIDPDDVKSEIRAGYWVMASVTGFAYPNVGKPSKGNKGVSFQLNSIQKIAEDETFGGMSIPAADEFADDEDDVTDVEPETEEETTDDGEFFDADGYALTFNDEGYLVYVDGGADYESEDVYDANGDLTDPYGEEDESEEEEDEDWEE